MWHERNAAIVSVLCLVALLGEYGNDRVFSLLWDFPLAPDEGGKLMELHGPVLLKSEFQQSRGKAIRSCCFRVCHCLYRCDNLAFPLLWDFPLAPDEGGKPMELQQDGPVLLKSEFSSPAGRPSGPIAFAFAIAFIAAAISSSVGSIPKARATGCCGSLFGMSGSSMSDFAFGSERKNRTHL